VNKTTQFINNDNKLYYLTLIFISKHFIYFINSQQRYNKLFNYNIKPHFFKVGFKFYFSFFFFNYWFHSINMIIRWYNSNRKFLILSILHCLSKNSVKMVCVITYHPIVEFHLSVNFNNNSVIVFILETS
jgi:hypothetical protein